MSLLDYLFPRDESLTSYSQDGDTILDAVNRNAEAKRTLMHKSSRAADALDELARSLDKRKANR